MSQTTKRAIAASQKKLLETTPLSKITIADIAEDCCISRMTFYYHFQDIYDLVKWICFDEGSRALSCMADGASWQEGFRSLCSCVLENRAFYVNVYHSVPREQLENHLYREVFGLLCGFVEQEARGAQISEQDKEFIADFYKYALVGVVLDWVKGGMRETPEQLTAKLSRLLNGQFALAIENFRSDAVHG